MTLEAEKIDLRTAKLQAEHEVKTIKSQLERERIEVARQRDVREKGTVCVSAVCACVCLSPRVCKFVEQDHAFRPLHSHLLFWLHVTQSQFSL